MRRSARRGWSAALAVILASAGALVGSGCKGDVESEGPGTAAGTGAGASGAGRAGAGAGAGARAGAGAGSGAGAGASGAGRAGAGAGAGSGGRAAAGGAGGSAGAGAGGGDAATPDAGADAEMDSGTQPPASPCPAGSFGDPLPPAGERTAVLVQGGFDFLEGPVWHAGQGVLFFSDMHMGGSGFPPATIVRFTPPATFAPFVDQAGSNGLALDLQGDLLACTHDLQTISGFDADDAQRSTLPLTYMGDHFNSPNDLTVRSDGTIYFTDPDWQLGGRTSETGMTGVYRVPPGGAPLLVDGSLDKPNGIALSPDEQTLYVSSAGTDLMAYAVAADGSTGTGTVLASPGGSDGMAVDCAGNLYVTAGSVRVFDPQGNELGSISAAEQPANVAFGGSDRRTLYITARTSLYAIELNVPGYPY